MHSSFDRCVWHRHGYDGQQKCTICDTHGSCPSIWSILKPIFCQVRLIRCAYESLRCLDIEIWWFLCGWQTTDDVCTWGKNYFHACFGTLEAQVLWIENLVTMLLTKISRCMPWKFPPYCYFHTCIWYMLFWTYICACTPCKKMALYSCRICQKHITTSSEAMVNQTSTMQFMHVHTIARREN